MKKLFTSLTFALTIGLPTLVFADGEGGAVGGWLQKNSMLLLLALMLVFFYFIILRPERKRRRQMEERRNAMKKGDKVTTSTGIRATIHKIEGDAVIVKLYDGAKMELLKAAITEIEANPGMESQPEDKKVELADSRT